MIEGCEESGSYDLPHYIDLLADRIGSPSLVVCLDSGCGNYDQLWSTTSLRGLVTGTLRVDVLDEGIHSGDASGVVPSSFRIMRSLLDRIEGLERVELAESESCCGSAGIYSMLRPRESAAILDERLRALSESGARTLVTANPGCQMQWEAGARRAGIEVEVLHIAEVLERALRT